MTISLNFATLPSEQFFTARSILIGLPEPLESRLMSLPLTLDRVRSAIMFAELSAKQIETWRASAYLRAALAEFCSIEDVQKVDKPGADHLTLRNSDNPLLHLLTLARHLSIHVKSVKTSRQKVSTSFDNQSFDLDVYIMSDLNAVDLSKLRNGKSYALTDLHKTVEWFSAAQLHWGAGYLIRIGVETFANKLCDHYGL